MGLFTEMFSYVVGEDKNFVRDYSIPCNEIRQEFLDYLRRLKFPKVLATPYPRDIWTKHHQRYFCKDLTGGYKR